VCLELPHVQLLHRATCTLHCSTVQNRTHTCGPCHLDIDVVISIARRAAGLLEIHIIQVHQRDTLEVVLVIAVTAVIVAQVRRVVWRRGLVVDSTLLLLPHSASLSAEEREEERVSVSSLWLSTPRSLLLASVTRASLLLLDPKLSEIAACAENEAAW
jgi:hypothetical protein